MNHFSNLFVVMGVSGCGKSSVASILAERTNGLYLDADDFHPPGNRAKMAAGIPLADDDRWGWLDTLNHELKVRARSGKFIFLACSALRCVYRDQLTQGLPGLKFIYLQGTELCIRRRMEARQDHFMPVTLLESQFALLEEPEDAIIVSIEEPMATIVETVLSQVQAGCFSP